MNEVGYIQKITGLEIDIEWLKKDIKKLEEEKEYFRKECNENANLISEFLEDIKIEHREDMTEKWEKRKDDLS